MNEKKDFEKKDGRGGTRPNAGRKTIFKQKNKQLNIYFSTEILQKLEQIAQKLKTTKSDAVSYLIDRYDLDD